MEWHAQAIVEGLGARGHAVHVATSPLPRRPALKPLRPNGEIIEIGGRGEGLYDLAFFRELPAAAERLARDHSVDIVHAQGFAGIPLVLRPGGLPPVVTTIHGTLFSETPLDRRVRRSRPMGQRAKDLWRFKHRLAFWPLWQTFLAQEPSLIVDSDFTRRELRRANPRLRPAIVPLGLDLEQTGTGVRRSFDGSSLGEPADRAIQSPILLLAAGRLEPIKGFATLLNALSRLPVDLPDWRFVLAGDGPERGRLEAIAQRGSLRGRVLLAGRVSASELADWYASADLFLNPDEGQPAFGLVLAEALLSGTPVLASCVGAHPELLGPGDGALIPAGITEAWTGGIVKAIEWISSASARSRVRRQARASQRFGADRMLEGLEAAYLAAARDSSP